MYVCPQNVPTWMRKHVARVRDVELATGLTFFPGLDVAQAARLRTFLPTVLWPAHSLTPPSPKPGRWRDQPCPPQGKADDMCPGR